MAHDRDGDSKDMKGGTVIKDGGGRPVTERGSIVEGMGRIFQEAVEPRRKQR